MVDENIRFFEERDKRIQAQGLNAEFVAAGMTFSEMAALNKYTYNFTWLGVPIIQHPQDMVVMQELIWQIRPTVIIETGIAHGGSLLFYASLLKILGEGKVIGVDLEIRPHNRERIENHPMSESIVLVEGDSVLESTTSLIGPMISDEDVVLVVLDSKHTHNHVLKELNLYSKFVTPNSYCVVFDTTHEYMDPAVVRILQEEYRYSPWGLGSNPATAIDAFLVDNSNFKRDLKWDGQTLISNCQGGFLKRVTGV